MDKKPDVFWFTWSVTGRGEWTPAAHYLVQPKSSRRCVVHTITDVDKYADMDGSARFSALQADYPKPPPFVPYPEGDDKV